MNYHEILIVFTLLLVCINYISTLVKCNKFETRIKELEKENADLRGQIK